MTRLALMLTAAEAVMLPAFALGLLFLAAVAIERFARWLSPQTDPRELVERGRERGRQ